jgi:hypothetical protein
MTSSLVREPGRDGLEWRKWNPGELTRRKVWLGAKLLAGLPAALATHGPGRPDEAKEIGHSSIQVPGTEHSAAIQAGAAVTMLIVSIAGGTPAEEDLVGYRHAQKIRDFLIETSLGQATRYRSAPVSLVSRPIRDRYHSACG